MSRFYLPEAIQLEQQLELPAEISRHIQVFRCQPGQLITLFNGAGGEFSARIKQIQRKSVLVSVEQFHPIERELSCSIELWPALINNERMDWLIEKAVELGCSRIQPLQSQNCAFRLTASKADKKRQHWQAVAIAAAQQSGRTKIPTIAPIIDLTAAAALLQQLSAKPSNNLATVMSLQPAAPALLQLIQQQQTISNWRLISGPEGGLTAAEEQQLLNSGCQPSSLGKRILRAETAPIAALGLLTAFYL